MRQPEETAKSMVMEALGSPKTGGEGSNVNDGISHWRQVWF